MRYSLSAVVMAHPRRAESATRLAARLGRNTTVGYDPVADWPASPPLAATGAWAARHRKNDDEVLAQFLREKGYRTRLRVPNLVDHRELPSVAGNDEHGIRRSVCFQADHPWSVTESTMDTPPAWPQFYERRA